jgi:hypothetical protein
MAMRYTVWCNLVLHGYWVWAVPESSLSLHKAGLPPLRVWPSN